MGSWRKLNRAHLRRCALGIQNKYNSHLINGHRWDRYIEIFERYLESVEPENEEPEMEDEHTCDVYGCDQSPTTQGSYWRDSGYWCLCSLHSKMGREGLPVPFMKEKAIEREERRKKHPKGWLE